MRGIPKKHDRSQLSTRSKNLEHLAQQVFCPGQPIVWVSCPKLLKRYQRIAGDTILPNGKTLKTEKLPKAYVGSETLTTLSIDNQQKLFFNFGFLTLSKKEDLSAWFPNGEQLSAVVVADDEIGMIHDMALYRQSRVRLKDDEKRVDKGGFFNTEIKYGNPLAMEIQQKRFT